MLRAGGRPRELDTSACLACVPCPWCGPAPESGPPGVQLPWARVWSLRPLRVVLPWGCVSAIWLDGDRQPRAPPPIQSCPGLAAAICPCPEGRCQRWKRTIPRSPSRTVDPGLGPSWRLFVVVGEAEKGPRRSTGRGTEAGGAGEAGGGRALGSRAVMGVVGGSGGGRGRGGPTAKRPEQGLPQGGEGMLSQPLWPGCGQIPAWPLEAPSVQRG